MNKRLIWALVASTFATSATSLETPSPQRLAPSLEHAQTAYLSSQLLGRYHYKTQALDDAMSEKIFERYLKALDPERLFFTQADIDSFADARTRLDDAILRGNLSIPFSIFQRYEQRSVERLGQIPAGGHRAAENAPDGRRGLRGDPLTRAPGGVGTGHGGRPEPPVPPSTPRLEGPPPSHPRSVQSGPTPP